MTVQSSVSLDPAATVQDGLSVVDPGGPLARTWYFDGRFLRADGFRADQAYERALAGFVARGAGPGVVHGFEVGPASGDALNVNAGLAFAPSGRVVLLTGPVDLPTATLIARARGTLDPGEPPSTGHNDFAPCAPASPAGDVPVLPDPTLWVLTAAATETLCGEEERFGQLCADACATETDRSQAVEGVLFRLRPVTLALPAPAGATMAAAHLRSRVAAAWFAAERQATGPLISAAGQRSPLWCRGAQAANGEEVPIAVLHRDGSTTTWVDAWTARREVVESIPGRYWEARTARRPRSVAAAQLSQFQCQLADLELPAVSKVSGSTLLDAGLVELPSAGYLAVDPGGDVEAQLRAKFGPGVDLRLCVGRADIVPELLDAARHRDRISLTAGLGDPGATEHVDVLVPDGRLQQTTVAADALVGVAKLLPAVRDGETGSASSIRTMARDGGGTGWSWAAVGTGPLAAPNLPEPVVRLLRGQKLRRRRSVAVDAALQRLIRPDRAGAPGDGTITVWAQIVTSARIEDMRVGDVADVRCRTSLVATVDDVSLLDSRLTGEVRVVERIVSGTSAQPAVQINTVLDGFVDKFTVDDGAQQSKVIPIQAMTLRWLFATDADGVERMAVVLLTPDSDLNGVALVGTRTGGPETISVVLGRIGLRRDALDLVTGPAENAGWTSGLTGRFARLLQRAGASGLAALIGPIGPIGPLPGLTPVATAEFTMTTGAASPGSPARTEADTGIEVIAASLAAQGRDPAFAVGARNLLYGKPVTATSAVQATRDWVLFHRRREIICPGDAVAEPGTSTIRLSHRTVDSAEELKQLITALQNRQPLGDHVFTPVIDLEFRANTAQIASSTAALRQAWQSAARPGKLALLAAAGGNEGSTVALARIESLRAALAGVVDTGGAETGFLPDIPPELTALGVDGVLLSAGLRPVEPEVTTCVRLLRLSRTNAATLMNALQALDGDPGLSLEEFMAGLPVPVDAVSATFADDVLKNRDQLTAWWQNPRVLQVRALTPLDLGDGSDPLDARLARAKEAAGAVGMEISAQVEVRTPMPPCGVVVLLTVV
ncbi:hypothetical protein [Actinoplanes sp. M2I2]|uniref:hypothetical protein n=1 Tax=Actinoplanes sp. M2I2 TaxID=1734444 RepID=UPI002020ECE2|nr:hypothetical protein [Actinoplanes sp. M2I2]